MRFALISAAAAGALAASVAAAGASPSGWIESCIHSNHPASTIGGCGWLAAPGRYVLCHNYPDGIQMQLTCYGPRSRWLVNIPHDDPPGAKPTARRLGKGGRSTSAALEIKAGTTWYDSMPERTAETSCTATRTSFRCELRAYRLTFRRDGSFTLERSRVDPKTYNIVYTIVVRGS